MNNFPHAKHTNQPASCRSAEVHDLAEQCDHEYYMSGLDLPLGDLERARRARARINDCLIKVRQLLQTVVCQACLVELDHQLKLQREALEEIDRVWGESF